MRAYKFATHPHIGDNVICTGAVRNVMAARSDIVFVRPTECAELWAHNADVVDEAPIVRELGRVSYGSLTQERHCMNGNVVEAFTRSLCLLMGIDPVPIVTRTPCLYLDEAEITTTERWSGKLLLNANCQRCSRSKGYPHWQTVVDALKADIEIVQIGGNEARDLSPDLSGVTDMRGKTSTRGLIMAAYGCTAILSPPSAISNIGAAFHKPQIIVNAAREPDGLLDYPNAVHVSHAAKCGWGVTSGCISCTFGGSRPCNSSVHDAHGQWAQCQWETEPNKIIDAVRTMLNARL